MVRGKKGKRKSKAAKPAPRKLQARWADAPTRLRRWALRFVIGAIALTCIMVLAYRAVNPPFTLYMLKEHWRIGGIERRWTPIEDVSPVAVRSIVAAEDANFCGHWGFDINAIHAAIRDGSNRGASTITQQVVKNVYLWNGRSWSRKSLEALITPLVELFWTKRRIVEVYLNVAEFDEGVFGIEAAARSYFRVPSSKLNPFQAAHLAAVLPDPKGRSASEPSDLVRKRAESVVDGAATIDVDGRAACFQD